MWHPVEPRSEIDVPPGTPAVFKTPWVGRSRFPKSRRDRPNSIFDGNPSASVFAVTMEDAQGTAPRGAGPVRGGGEPGLDRAGATQHADRTAQGEGPREQRFANWCREDEAKQKDQASSSAAQGKATGDECEGGTAFKADGAPGAAAAGARFSRVGLGRFLELCAAAIIQTTAPARTRRRRRGGECRDPVPGRAQEAVDEINRNEAQQASLKQKHGISPQHTAPEAALKK